MHRLFGFPAALLAAGLALSALDGRPAAAQTGDPHRGHTLAQSWCASCHIIDRRGGGRTADAAPPFPAIADNPGRTDDHLRVAVTGEHTRMPNFNLGRREIDDLVAYIRSLRTPAGRPSR